MENYKRNNPITFYLNDDEIKVLKLGSELSFAKPSVFCRQEILKISEKNILKSNIPLDKLKEKYGFSVDSLWNQILNKKEDNLKG